MASSPTPRRAPKAARRLQRSTRITVAAALLGLAAFVVVVALLAPPSWLTPVSAVLAVALGAAATRITYAELVQSRVDAAADRASLAQDYRWMFEDRMQEHRKETSALRQAQEDTAERAAELEQSLVLAERRVSEASRKVAREARRAEEAETAAALLAERVETSDERIAEAVRRSDDAEARAAEAIVRLAELEHEADALRAELEGWRTAEPRRRHA